MIRLFVALTIPDLQADALMMLETGMRGARWRPRDNYHLTLKFIGEVDYSLADDIHSALSALHAPAFDLALSGCGQFGDRKPRALWAEARRSFMRE